MNGLLALVLALAAGGAVAFDPTAPSGIKAAAEHAPGGGGLAWVRVNGPHSIAWYGGTTVRLGDAVEGGRVRAIREDHIVISGRSGHRKVYLLDQPIRNNRGR